MHYVCNHDKDLKFRITRNSVFTKYVNTVKRREQNKSKKIILCSLRVNPYSRMNEKDQKSPVRLFNLYWSNDKKTYYSTIFGKLDKQHKTLRMIVSIYNATTKIARAANFCDCSIHFMYIVLFTLNA